MQRGAPVSTNAVLGDDCELTEGTRKACKNCTCGRAEGEGSESKLTLAMIESPAVNSSCGNVRALCV